jgi:hypothetical protein
MKRVIFILIILLASVINTNAQLPVISTNKIGWDMTSPSLTEAQGYTYRYYPDNATVGIALTNVTCIGTVSPFQCEVAFPAFAPGSHTLTLTASNLAGESPKSTPLNFTFIVTPNAPQNLIIK